MIQLFFNNLSQYIENKVFQMRIDLIPRSILYKSHVRPLNPDQKENLKNQIKEWLEQGVIKPSISLWESVFPVKKKDGRTRRVTDLRQLNKQMVKDSYPLTNIQEILHSLQGVTVFSSLDNCGTYYVIRIKP